jgi:hypothetical protein
MNGLWSISDCELESIRRRPAPGVFQRDTTVLLTSSPRHLIRRGDAAAVRGVPIVAVSASDRSRSAVIAGSIICTRGGSAHRSSTDSGSTDADRHSRTYPTVVTTTIDAPAIDTATINPAAIDSPVGEGVS